MQGVTSSFIFMFTEKTSECHGQPLHLRGSVTVSKSVNGSLDASHLRAVDP